MLLNRLIKLYRSSNQLNTPLENFTTEALVGVLEVDSNLLDDFVNKVLKIHGRGFKIESQKNYNYEETKRYIDVLVHNSEIICFIENKVDSDIRKDQLKIYAEILEEISKKIEKKVFLRLCTRFIESDFKSNLIYENDNEAYFKHFRWNDIYQFLKKYEDNHLVKDFRQFLKSNRMGIETALKLEDIQLLNDFQKIMPKFDEYRKLYTSSFKKIISENYKEQSLYKRLLEDNDMVIFAENILGEGAWSGIGTGLKIEEKTCFFVWIWLNEGNSKLSLFKSELKSLDPTFEGLEIHENGLTIRKPIEQFISENPNEKIKSWFEQNIIFVRKFIESTPNLGWKINLSKPPK